LKGLVRTAQAAASNRREEDLVTKQERSPVCTTMGISVTDEFEAAQANLSTASAPIRES
jgi:hypothetical protein